MTTNAAPIFLSNLLCSSVGQFRSGAIFPSFCSNSPQPRCIFHILVVRYPFKVFKAIVRRATVLVVTNLVLFWQAVKRRQDKAVNAEALYLPTFCQSSLIITLAIKVKGQYSAAFDIGAVLIVRYAIEAFHAATIADLIQALITGYIAPLFINQIVGGKMLFSHFATSFSVLVRRAFGVLAPEALCFVSPIIP